MGSLLFFLRCELQAVLTHRTSTCLLRQTSSVLVGATLTVLNSATLTVLTRRTSSVQFVNFNCNLLRTSIIVLLNAELASFLHRCILYQESTLCCRLWTLHYAATLKYHCSYYPVIMLPNILNERSPYLLVFCTHLFTTSTINYQLEILIRNKLFASTVNRLQSCKTLEEELFTSSVNDLQFL